MWGQGELMWGNVKPQWHNFVRALIILTCMFFAACTTESNHPPTANAGPNMPEAILGELIKLNAESSSDVDGDSLTYQWELIEKPENSQAELSSPTSKTPSLQIDKDGVYQLRLIVSDGKSFSKADFITITTLNDLPVAKAQDVTPNRSGDYKIGDVIVLDATDSFDPERQVVFYHWELILQPDGSIAELDSINSVSTRFTADVSGAYIVHLIVDDGVNQSIPATIIFNVAPGKKDSPTDPNRPFKTKPIAEAGPDQRLDDAAVLIQLDGTGSSDAENDPLTYLWEMIAKPEGSRAALSDTTVARPLFTADVLGSYVVQLIVDDGIDGQSVLDTVVITPHENPQLACEDCHNDEITSGKKVGHLITYDDCFNCHFTGNFRPNKGNFHAHGHRAKPFQCDICHNGVDAKGKPVDHVVTSKDCNACHLISNGTWVPALAVPGQPQFSHEGIFSGCKSCHDGVIQQGKPEGHMPSSSRCNACHKPDDGWLPARILEHTQALGECRNCHADGVEKKIKPADHIQASDNCLACHNPDSWLPLIGVDHNELFGACFDCHDGKVATGKSATHIASPEFCDLCHNVINWNQAIFRHNAEINGLACVDCHDGTQAKGQATDHITTTKLCEGCHSLISWVTKSINHQQVVGTCKACHDQPGNEFQTNHIPTTDKCDACHNTFKWIEVRLVSHEQVIGHCVVCHDNVRAKWKTRSHISTTNNCEACHTELTFKPTATVDHNEVVKDNCGDCHNGLVTTGQPRNHIKVNGDCSGCHKSSLKWAETLSVDHSLVSDDCESCHDGNVAKTKSALHIATSNKCDACHSVADWIVAPNGVDHNHVIGGCEDCHVIDGNTMPHIPVENINCNSCHRNTTDFTDVPVVRHRVIIGACVNCHSSADILSHQSAPKSAATCDECHSTTQWPKELPSLHPEQPRPCVDCHNDELATGKKQGHLPVSDLCSSCHYAEQWVPVIRVDHLETIGPCAHCHFLNITISKPYDHIIASNTCDTCHSTERFAPAVSIDHTRDLGDCITCHNGFNSTGKSDAHISSSDFCEACHEATTWLPVLTTEHNHVLGDCGLCHNNLVSTGKPQGHITSDDLCENCHANDVFKPALPSTHFFVDLSQSCATCHNDPPFHHLDLGLLDNCQNCHVISSWFPQARPLPVPAL